MLLTIKAALSSNDLGYLLHKNPSRVHSFDLSFGKAHVFYPQMGEQEAQAALLLDVDPVGLVRGSGKPGAEGALEQYVNDRPYAASSFLSVALSRVFGSAMGGRSRERQALADEPAQWEARLAAVPSRDGEATLRGLFEPLGYAVSLHRHPLDERFPEWGEGVYYTVTLNGRVRLQDLLTHIYVLIPVLDADKHYWVGSEEVDKLLRKGEGWLAAHPQRDLIVRRYLRFDRKLTRDALARLMGDDLEDPEADASAHLQEEQSLEQPMRLWEQRVGAVVSALRSAGAKSVIDLGCGEGRLVQALLEDRSFERIAGMDVGWRSLERARKRLRLDQLPQAHQERVTLLHGSLMYRDRRLSGYDAATVIEVIEHLDPPRLAAFERVVFAEAQPRTVVVTTPNAEYNVRFPSLPAGQFRHRDHRFEWTRSEFAQWADGIASRLGYRVQYLPVGSEDAAAGAPTQMGVFTR